LIGSADFYFNRGFAGNSDGTWYVLLQNKCLQLYYCDDGDYAQDILSM